MTEVNSSQSDLENGTQVVHMPSLSQPVQVQSVIQSNQPSVIQTAGPNVQTIQVVRVAAVDEDNLSDDSESKKRREILSRRPSYRKILNELSSPVAVTKVEEESNSSQSQDGESQEATNLSTGAVQYQHVLPTGAIQISSNPDGNSSVGQGLQTLTMTNASPSTTSATTGATIVQYAQGPDGQFYIPDMTGTVQAYQIATSGSLPQGVVMATTGSTISSPQNLSEEASRKRELRLLKNREAARECRRKKKDYVKCLENRVAVLENQNKTLIEELKALKELYCQKEENAKPVRLSLHLIAKRNLPPDATSWTQDEMLEALNRISHLRLDRENIRQIDGFELLGDSVRNLYLQQNRIERIENLDCLQSLQFITLAGNSIKVVENLDHLQKLFFLDLSDNNIQEIDPDEFPKSLLILNLKGNPCTRLTDYRISLIRVLPRLQQLDEADVTREEKERAGLEVSEDEEEEDDEEEDELQKKKGLGDIDIKDVTTRILVRSQHRLEKHMESHKKYGGGIYEVRGQTTGQSSLPPSARSVKSTARSITDSSPSSQRSNSSEVTRSRRTKHGPSKSGQRKQKLSATELMRPNQLYNSSDLVLQRHNSSESGKIRQLEPTPLGRIPVNNDPLGFRPSSGEVDNLRRSGAFDLGLLRNNSSLDNDGFDRMSSASSFSSRMGFDSESPLPLRSPISHPVPTTHPKDLKRTRSWRGRESPSSEHTLFPSRGESPGLKRFGELPPLRIPSRSGESRTKLS
ncbi:hypothetical protein FSP39_024605 [Pinctada imbricata]|uniref:Uncharacterized protein n=1 Tax=Pinctada imbricata TaxID=66713 RepID=A0AA88YXN3_PINIB|nr:hypothetical protein FSP39_024605 [Pinctada imbricata]